jgi:hypothetical protein
VKTLYNVLDLKKYVIYALVIIALLVPLVKPLGIPVKITADTRKFYAAIEDLQAGDIVLWDINFQLAGASELAPQITAMAYHMAQRGAKCIIVSMHPEAYPFALNAVQEFKDLGRVYGEDMVYLGYLPGEEVAIASLLSDLHQTVPNDYEGTPIASLPLTANVKTGNDLSTVVSINTNASGPAYWTRQVQAFENLDLLFASQASLKTQIQTYLATGQMKASLDGARCTAEYELMLGKPGKALAMQDASSSTFLVFLLFVVFGNIVQHLNPPAKGKEDAK